MKLVFFGTGAYGIPALEVLAKSRHSILSVVTSADKPRGRSLQSAPSLIHETAKSLGLPIFIYDKARAAEAAAHVRSLAPDFLIVVSFGFLLSRELLSIPKVAPLNIHPSLLPRHRGASPMPWAILEGDTETGVTLIRMNERMDAGDAAAQIKTPLGASEDLVMLEKRLATLGASLIVETLDAAEKTPLLLHPQDESRATYTRKFCKEDARLDFSKSSEELSRRVRAFRGWPGTFATLRQKRILVHRAISVAGEGVPGAVLRVAADGIDVAAGSGALSLQAVQLEGKKEMSVADFLRGFPVKPGERFE